MQAIMRGARKLLVMAAGIAARQSSVGQLVDGSLRLVTGQRRGAAGWWRVVGGRESMVGSSI
jgi:hypothetical protein